MWRFRERKNEVKSVFMIQQFFFVNFSYLIYERIRKLVYQTLRTQNLFEITLGWGGLVVSLRIILYELLVIFHTIS